jgi:hypothetical protein
MQPFLKTQCKSFGMFFNGVAPLSAKMRFRPQGGIAFLPPDLHQATFYTFMG